MDEENEETTEEVDEERDEVAEESEPETDEEATEQRTDDYDGLARRLDDVMEAITSGFEAMTARFDAMGLSDVEGVGFVSDDVSPDEIESGTEEKIDELLGIDSLDLL
jgi:hypothetical protein